MPGVSGGQPEGARLSPEAIATYAYTAGVHDKAARVIAVAIALAESGGDPKATHRNSDAHKTIDYGLWQINGYWHKAYSPEELLTPAGNAKAMAEISKNGTDWSAWATYANGNYKSKLGEAEGGATVEVNGVGDAISDIAGAFTLDNLMGLVLAGVFCAAALAIVAIGLSKITGVDPTKAVAGASTAATAAQLAAL